MPRTTRRANSQDDAEDDSKEPTSPRTKKTKTEATSSTSTSSSSDKKKKGGKNTTSSSSSSSSSAPSSSSSSSSKHESKGDEAPEAAWVQRRLLNKVVLITGAGGAIGRGCAVQIALQGAKVAVGDMDAEKGAATVSEILAKGGEAFFHQFDVSQEAAVKHWIELCVEKYGKIDVLVNNAAAFVFGTIEEASNEDWDKVLGVNVKGYAFCAKYVVTQMKKQKTGGSIINIGSISSFIAQPSFVPYNASKGAVLQLTRCLAYDHGPDGIRVNSVCPGTIETPATHLHAKKLNKTFAQLKSETLKDHLIKRLGTVDDVAFAVIYLASDESTFVTGAHIPVDAGYLAH